MSFIKRIIKDRIVSPSKRYELTKVNGTDNIYDLTQQGAITEVGTPINSELLQRYEDTLEEHETAIGTKADGTIVNNISNIVADIQLGTVQVGSAKNSDKLGNKLPSEYAQTNHASAATTYGPGTPTLHGHVKTINALTQASHIDGTALSAYQGKVLNDKIDNLTKTFITKGANSKPSNTNLTYDIDIPINTNSKLILLDLSTDLVVPGSEVVIFNGLLSVKIHKPTNKVKGHTVPGINSISQCIFDLNTDVNIFLAQVLVGEGYRFIYIRKINIIGSTLRISLSWTGGTWSCIFDYMMEELV